MNKEAVQAALRDVFIEEDYDLYKEIDAEPNGFLEIAEYFIEQYEEAISHGVGQD